jgi:hypothetical protein
MAHGSQTGSFIGQHVKDKDHERLADKKDWDGTGAVFRRMLALDPHNLEVAEYLGSQGYPYEATRLFAAAFAASPKSADVQTFQNARYSAACNAAMAGSGKDNSAKLNDTERAGLRMQAREWLRADLIAYTKLLDSGGNGVFVEYYLRQWKRDSELHGIRDRDALADLPADEREAF